MVGPAAKREGVAHLQAVMGLSERRACSIVDADRKMIRYRSRRAPDTELRTRLRDLANERRRFGYRRLFILLRQEGEPSGINRIYRLYREEGLTVRKRRARRRAVGTRAPILVEAAANARWSLDFVHDQFACGRRFRILNIVDDVTRECLAAIPDTSISGRRVARELTASDRAARQAGHDRFRQRDRVHLERHARLGAGQQDRLAFHRAGKADAERLLRELQRPHARRASQREPVPRPRPCPGKDRELGRRLQPAAAAFGAGLSHAGGLCRQSLRNMRSAAQPRPTQHDHGNADGPMRTRRRKDDTYGCLLTVIPHHSRYLSVLIFLLIATPLVAGFAMPESTQELLKDKRTPAPAPSLPHSMDG